MFVLFHGVMGLGCGIGGVFGGVYGGFGYPAVPVAPLALGAGCLPGAIFGRGLLC